MPQAVVFSGNVRSLPEHEDARAGSENLHGFEVAGIVTTFHNFHPKQYKAHIARKQAVSRLTACPGMPRMTHRRTDAYQLWPILAGFIYLISSPIRDPSLCKVRPVMSLGTIEGGVILTTTVRSVSP
jgi:hypothetical protein